MSKSKAGNAQQAAPAADLLIVFRPRYPTHQMAHLNVALT